MTTAYLAAEGFEAELLHELEAVRTQHGRLMICDGPERSAAWAQNVWRNCEELQVSSISEAATMLRARARNWALYSHTHHRRGALIQAKLPHFAPKPIAPYADLPTAPVGSFTLLDRDTMLVSATCSSPFAHGEVRFVENRIEPPSRAYLKLWEALTLCEARPGPTDLVIDMGSSPGGWTWVLAELGAQVVSVDKAPLAGALAARRNVTFRTESAFAVDPFTVDWFFSDVICYPGRLIRMIERWRPFAKRFVCTVKFQGETDHNAAATLAAIPGSRLIHLSHNRHELTWISGI